MSHNFSPDMLASQPRALKAGIIT